MTQTVKILLQCRRLRLDPWVRKLPGRRAQNPILVFLPGKFHEQRILVGYDPWSCKESDTTERICISIHPVLAVWQYHQTFIFFSVKVEIQNPLIGLLRGLSAGPDSGTQQAARKWYLSHSFSFPHCSLNSFMTFFRNSWGPTPRHVWMDSLLISESQNAGKCLPFLLLPCNIL